MSDRAPVLRIHLFGGLALAWDQAPMPTIPSPVARSLLAYLVTYRDRPHTRDLLAGTFWPDLPDDTARRRLSQALWQIQRTVGSIAGSDVLRAEGDTIQLNPDLPLWIDAEEFTRHKAQCTQGNLEALEHCARCNDLYRGEFLAGYYDDWLLLERERLREDFLGVLERLVAGLKAQGDYEGALPQARRLAAEDPLHEEAHCEVMRLYHLLGRDGEALQQYQICRQVLADELDAEPSASMIALAGEIAAQAEMAEVPHLPVAPRPAPLALLERPHQVSLVGRQAERAELARHLELSMAGHGGMVFLVGEAGAGKTRLVQEIARDAGWRGARVVWGHSCELSAPLPYQPLVEVLHDADLGHLPEIWRQELGRLIPGLAPAPPALSEPEQERGRMVEALTRATLALGQAAPHLVILEDVHWMDPASFEVLRVLLPRLPESRLLVVATFRPEELASQPVARQSLMALEATRAPRRLQIASLTEAETGELIRRVLDLAQPLPRFSRRLYAGTEGNPFFLTETLWTLVEQGLLYRDETGKWRVPWDDATEDYAELPVPLSIAQSIEQRLARLSPSVQRLLGIAAVIGRQVAFDLWLAAGECDEETMLAAAEELCQRGLTVEPPEALGYSFTHDTIRQVVYERLGPMQRRRLHRRVAAALEVQHPDKAEALARHWCLAQSWPQAVRYALRAGERAQAVYANQQALEHYHRANTWLDEGRVDWPADEIAHWQATLSEKQGQVHSLVGQYESADAALIQAWRIFADLDDWDSAVRVLNQLSFLCFIQDDYAGASRYAAAALAALPQPDPPAGLWAITLTHLGLSAWAQGRYDDAQPALEQALALFEGTGTDQYDLARCLNSLGLVHLERGNLALADHYFARSLSLRRQIGDRRGEAWCWHNQGRVALARGDLGAARERLETAQAMFGEIEHPYGLDTCTRFLTEVAQAEARQAPPGSVSPVESPPESHGTGYAEGPGWRVTVRLPRVDAPTGRPLRDDEYTTVAWTVDSPADQRIQGKAARRQHRLLRLLEEAQAQGAAPTHDHLAEALGVSRRTIERDVALLRRQRHLTVPPTRGKMSQ